MFPQILQDFQAPHLFFYLWYHSTSDLWYTEFYFLLATSEREQLTLSHNLIVY